MQHLKSDLSTCNHCQNYVPMGQRGGYCTLLSVTVKGGWKACSLGTPFFATTAQPRVELTLSN
ncbi:MAG: hypothetical protein VKL59_25850 [Nostocaceae cyanobacterium]|nr:hypothetical protein [Nostocaceae cyanobacterium]